MIQAENFQMLLETTLLLKDHTFFLNYVVKKLIYYTEEYYQYLRCILD